MIKADLKHWGGRRGVNGHYEIDYGRFVQQAHNRLGDGGVVGIPNARGPDNLIDKNTARNTDLKNFLNSQKKPVQLLP